MFWHIGCGTYHAATNTSSASARADEQRALTQPRHVHRIDMTTAQDEDILASSPVATGKARLFQHRGKTGWIVRVKHEDPDALVYSQRFVVRNSCTSSQSHCTADVVHCLHRFPCVLCTIVLHDLSARMSETRFGRYEVTRYTAWASSRPNSYRRDIQTHLEIGHCRAANSEMQSRQGYTTGDGPLHACRSREWEARRAGNRGCKPCSLSLWA